jgi:hypothetical protein
LTRLEHRGRCFHCRLRATAEIQIMDGHFVVAIAAGRPDDKYVSCTRVSNWLHFDCKGLQ